MVRHRDGEVFAICIVERSTRDRSVFGAPRFILFPTNRDYFFYILAIRFSPARRVRVAASVLRAGIGVSAGWHCGSSLLPARNPWHRGDDSSWLVAAVFCSEVLRPKGTRRIRRSSNPTPASHADIGQSPIPFRIREDSLALFRAG